MIIYNFTSKILQKKSINKKMWHYFYFFYLKEINKQLMK